MSSVAEILQSLADVSGQAALRKGAIYGGIVSGVSQIPAQISAEKERQAALQLHTSQVQQQMDLERSRGAREDQLAGHQNAADAKAALDQQHLGAIIGAGFSADPKTFDQGAAVSKAQQLGRPDLIPTVAAVHEKFTKKPTILKEGEQGFDATTNAPIPGMSVPEKQTPEARQIFLLSKQKSGVPLTKSEQADVDAFTEVKAPKTPSSLDEQLLQAIKDGDTEGASKITQTMKTAAAAKGDPAAVAAANRQASTIAAQIAQQGRAQSFTEAQAGRGELTNKVEAPYLDAREKADTLRNVVALAKSGNKEAANVQGLLGVLGLVTSEGVKRINTTELDQVAGAGSLFDKIKGKAGKIVAGQPLDAGLQNDLVQLSNMLETSARKKYEQGFKQAKTRYGLKDEIALTPSGAPDKGTEGVVGGKPAVWDYRNDQWGWWPK